MSDAIPEHGGTNGTSARPEVTAAVIYPAPPGKRGDIYKGCMEPHPKLWMNPDGERARDQVALTLDTKCLCAHPLREHASLRTGLGTCLMAGCGCQRFREAEEAKEASG